MEKAYSEIDLNNAVTALRSGGVILYPTDTVWGLGCDATNPTAVAKLKTIKGRSAGKAFIVLVDSPARIENYTINAPDIAFELIETAIEPLTIIFDEGKNIAEGVCNTDGSLGMRVTKETFSKLLCRKLGRPVVSTSANMAGEITPACYNQISPALKEKVDYIVEAHRDDIQEHMPSHIIKVGNNGVIKIIR